MNIGQIFKGLIVLTLVLLVFFGIAVVADKPSKILIMPLEHEETPSIEFATYSIDQPEYVVSRHRENLEPREYRMPRIPKYEDDRTDEYRHYMFHYYWEDYEWRDDPDEHYYDDHYDEEKYDCYVLNWRGHRTYIDCEDAYWY